MIENASDVSSSDIINSGDIL